MSDAKEKIEDAKDSKNNKESKKPSPQVIIDVTERVYQMLLRDLTVARERQRFNNPHGRLNV